LHALKRDRVCIPTLSRQCLCNNFNFLGTSAAAAAVGDEDEEEQEEREELEQYGVFNWLDQPDGMGVSLACDHNSQVFTHVQNFHRFLSLGSRLGISQRHWKGLLWQCNVEVQALHPHLL
jgi:hypothetical protein